ncbi:probable glycosyltransferase At3g07620 isoform X2 [Chenopodium quinoa]|uniref:probable glycosyltransferase At3g07620 isoform X2 n=1 Tax=Chenopodium quinoa TaxID=63459 RepID=UPI000B776E12|nr:probable glycosyltransferase At3g07620 isoform X2 [Chenopodium quinoa]
MGMEYSAQFQKLCQIEARRSLIIVGIVAIAYVMLQFFMLPYGNAFKFLLPDNEVSLSAKSGYSSNQSSVRAEKEGEINPSSFVEVVREDDKINDDDDVNEDDNVSKEFDRTKQDIVALEGNDRDESLGLDKPLKFLDVMEDNNSKVEADNAGKSEIVGLEDQNSFDSGLELNESSSFHGNENVESWNQANHLQAENVRKLPDSDLDVPKNDSEVMSVRRRKKVRPGMPPLSVTPIVKMNQILARHLASSSKMEIFDAKSKIIYPTVSDVDKELHAPVFRNVSTFMRSYELMEKTLKVYVYRDGKRPIFHQPTLKGLYASEGWFMKLMEGNKHFVVKNPNKAHLFYMPFSSRMLEYALYVPNSHNRTNLRQFMKGYTEAIAAKYPFWNRTGGTDHFVVACHDWAPYETRHHMEESIKALCNADITIGFKIGRDVSLPETFVRYARNPLRDIGGKPPSKRNILAFYAGNSHGYLRPILLKHWKGKDPDMKIYGLLPTSVSRRMNYMQHMKSSKYCICPKGHEVNSPRVVEAIFYECVPVIISDNFVPPFFEILNWEAFSVIVAEKDIPNLKDILVSIPEERYIEMQLAVKKVQRHFLWHSRPVKYDLFHMILHSIWYSRVFQIRRQ